MTKMNNKVSYIFKDHVSDENGDVVDETDS